LRAFANLLDRLAFTPARNGKLTLLRDYFREAPDPERGWALAALTGVLGFEAAKPSFIRKAVEARMDPELFHLSPKRWRWFGPRNTAPTASRNYPKSSTH
jgi:DNA ligase-1